MEIIKVYEVCQVSTVAKNDKKLIFLWRRSEVHCSREQKLSSLLKMVEPKNFLPKFVFMIENNDLECSSKIKFSERASFNKKSKMIDHSTA